MWVDLGVRGCDSIVGKDMVDGSEREHVQGEDAPSSIIAASVTVKEGSMWSARSVASTNDVDADER